VIFVVLKKRKLIMEKEDTVFFIFGFERREKNSYHSGWESGGRAGWWVEEVCPRLRFDLSLSLSTMIFFG